MVLMRLSYYCFYYGFYLLFLVTTFSYCLFDLLLLFLILLKLQGVERQNTPIYTEYYTTTPLLYYLW